jgi:hypothetical protein
MNCALAAAAVIETRRFGPATAREDLAVTPFGVLAHATRAAPSRFRDS